MRPRVLVTRRLPQPALDIVAAACEMELWPQESEPMPREQLLARAAHADGLLCLLTDRIDSELLAAAPQLRVAAVMAVGYDSVDVPALTARRVLLTNTPGVLTETTADLAWALILAASRRIVEGHKLIDADGWGRWSPMQMVGRDVFGATIGVVGAGRIGTAVLRRAAGFSMQLRYHNRRPDPQLEQQLGAQYRSLEALLAESDVVVVTAPLTEQTRGMFGAAEFARMKETAVFVNVARGGLVREDDLFQALQRGRPWAAGLDVFAHEPITADHPLLQLPQVVAVPHIGSATVATRTRMATLAAENVVAALTGRPVPSPVNAELLDAAGCLPPG